MSASADGINYGATVTVQRVRLKLQALGVQVGDAGIVIARVGERALVRLEHGRHVFEVADLAVAPE